MENKRIWYKKIQKCYCPLLKQDIVFNAKGFNHLLFNGLGKPRIEKERIYRLKLLTLSINVLQNASSVVEYTHHNTIEYWKLQECVGSKNQMIVVILKRIGKGQIFFYSIWEK